MICMCICRQCAQNAHRPKLLGEARPEGCPAKATPSRNQPVGVLKLVGCSFPAAYSRMLGVRSAKVSRKMNLPASFLSDMGGQRVPPRAAARLVSRSCGSARTTLELKGCGFRSGAPDVYFARYFTSCRKVLVYCFRIAERLAIQG